MSSIHRGIMLAATSLAVILLVGCATAPADGPAVGERVTLTVLGTTDVHGRLFPYDYYTGEATDRGLAKVATLVDSIRQSDPHVVLLDSGDLLQGNPLDYVYGVVERADVHPVILAMNRLGYDAAVLGNHEFNYGVPALERALEDAAFPFLAANVHVAGTDSLRWPGFTVIERGGVRVGVIGLTTPGSAIWDRANVEGRLEFADIVASAERVWPALERASDVQVAVVHTGLGPGSSYDEAATGVPPENAGAALAEALPGLDLVLLGHSHTDIPSETVNGVLFTQAGQWAEALAMATLDLERTETGWRVVDKRATTLSTEGVPPDPEFLEELRPYHERTIAFVGDTIGWTPVAWTTAGARLEDTPIIDLIQRVQLDATGADLSAASAFTDAARIEAGAITVADAASLYVYDNTLRAIEITGQQLRAYLEFSAKYFHRTTPDGEPIGSADGRALAVDSIPGYNYDMVAGVDYTIDLTRPVGERIRDLTYRGEPVADDRTFTMAINNYRQGGGGGYTMIADAPLVYDAQQSIRRLLIDWIAERDTLRPKDVYEPSWRIVPGAAVELARPCEVRGLPSAAADTSRLGRLAEREAERIAGDARARVDTTAAGDAGLAAADTTRRRCAPPDTTRLGPIGEREGERIGGEAGSRVSGRLAAVVGALPAPYPADSDTVRLAFVSTNDFHGALEPTTPAWAGGDTVGGAATLAAYVNAIEARYPGATLHLDGGDVMQGTVISNLTGGRSTVDAFNAIGVDAAAIGNHEFDWGIDTLTRRIAQADFSWLAANVFVKATGARPEWIEPFAWLEAGGLEIAVIGAATVQTPSTTLAANVAPFEFRDIATVVDELAPELKREGADLIVVAAHAGAIAGEDGYQGEIVDAARRITGPVDLIVSGHTHTRVATEVNGIPIVQANSSGTAIGVVTLAYDRVADRVVDHAVDVITTSAAGVRPDEAVAALVARWDADVADVATRPIATLERALPRRRGTETALGDLIADAQRDATGTRIALMNGGGIRAGLEAGEVSYEDVFRVQPFQNTLVRLELTGEQLRRALEAVVDDRIGQVSGIRFAFDPTRPEGSRVVRATLEEGDVPVVADGRAVDRDAVYTVTVNNFMATGGSGYGVLEEAAVAESTGLVDSDVLAAYLERLPQPVRHEPAGRMERLAPWPEPRE